MKYFILICSLFVIVHSNRLPEEEEAKLFNDYLSNYQIKIGRADAGAKREIFLNNYYDIEEHNKGFNNGTKSYEREINEFSHLSQEEFFQTHTGYIPFADNATTAPSIPSRSSRMATPGSFSWRDMPWTLGPTTNQGGCGSCTIFAVIGTMEAHMRIWYGYKEKLSEQEAMPCCGGCGGGTNSYVYDYAKNGATYEKDLPYLAKVTEECNTRRARVPGSKVSSYYRIQRGADAVKNGMWHLANVGPLATGLCVPGSFQSYKGGVYDEENMNNCGWHAVMIVGFGNENGKDYWLARNSWGASWGGDDGFFKIARGKNLCRLEDDLTFPNMRSGCTNGRVPFNSYTRDNDDKVGYECVKGEDCF